MQGASSSKHGAPPPPTAPRGTRRHMTPQEYKDHRRAKNTESVRRNRAIERANEREMHQLYEQNELRIQQLERQAAKLSKELTAPSRPRK